MFILLRRVMKMKGNIIFNGLLIFTLLIVSDSVMAAAAGTVNYSLYAPQVLNKVAGDSEYIDKYTIPKQIERHSFTMSNQYSSYTTTVTYESFDKSQRCRFTAGYILKNGGPVYSSKVEKLIPSSKGFEGQWNEIVR